MVPTPRMKKASYLVIYALGKLKSSESNRANGVTAKQVVDFLSNEYDFPTTGKRDIREALQCGVAFGTIQKRGRKYFFNESRKRNYARQESEERFTTMRRRRKSKSGKRRKRSKGRRRRHDNRIETAVEIHSELEEESEY